MSTSLAVDVDVDRVTRLGLAELIGRDDELTYLDDAWARVQRDERPRSHVITLAALGGKGKTPLVAKWLARIAHAGRLGCE